jgi:hypothetical protein
VGARPEALEAPGEPSPRLARPWPSTVATVATVAVGLVIVGFAVVLRLDMYLSGRSLWLDESLLALNIIDRPISRLSEPLDLSQGAPLGFLVSSKLVVLALGKSELAFRLVPLLSGIASLGFFYVLVRRVSTNAAALLGLALLACSAPFVYYSAEFKQYSTEVAATVGLSAVAIATRPTLRRYVAVALLGAVLLWFAFTTIFFLTAFGAAYGLAFLVGRRWKELAAAAGLSLLWLGSAFAVYRVTYADLDSLESAVQIASTGGRASDTAENLHEAASTIAVAALGVAGGSAPGRVVAGLALALSLTGVGLLLRAKPYACLMLVLPIAAMFGAVLIGRYPVFERTLLIAVPSLILFVAHGAASVSRRLGSRAGLVVGVAFAALLLAYPLKSAIGAIDGPRRNDQAVRPLLYELVERWEPNDGLYVHYAAQYAFRYYLECDCIGDRVSSPPLTYATRRTTGPRLWHGVLRSRPPGLEIGKRHDADDVDAYRRELDRLRSRERVWYLYSHWESEEEGRLVKELLPRHLDRLGRRTSTTRRGRAGLVLYDLDP